MSSSGAAGQAVQGLGKLRPGGWNVGLCDGCVRPTSSNIDAESLQAMFTQEGGEVIPDF